MMRTAARLLLGAWAVCATCRSAPAETVPIVGDAATAVVVVPAGATLGSGTLRGAIDVAEYVHKITSRRLPLVAEGRGAYRHAAERGHGGR